ncbi:MAG: glycosyltransferase family 2 protein [Bacteroidales bacterium]|nr:glycosyltransferase family 2 protein [Bacteroidales bacterium]
MKLSVICPIYNEEKHIASCLESILQQDFPKEEMEVLLVDGMSTDRTREIVQQYTEQYPFIFLLDNPKRIVPTGLNIGIRVAQGDVIIRLDAHAIYPDNYFSALVDKLFALNADNVGGLCRTLPAKETPVCEAIAAALSSPFGMGDSHFRIGTNKEMQVDTVPFGCFRREVFDKIGYFDEELIRNQDDEFNGRIIKYGGHIYLIPSIVINYYGRDSIGKVAKMFYQYGLFKPLVNKKLGNPATVRQFFPPLFVVGLIGGLLLSFVHPIFCILYMIVLALYLFLAIYFSVKQFKNIKKVLLLIATFVTIHVSYGWGYLCGCVKLLLKRNLTAESNH